MRLAIIHFTPLEYFPPTINFLQFISDKPGIQTQVFTCANINDREIFQAQGVKITRFSSSNAEDRGWVRLLKYLRFNLFTLAKLIYLRPTHLLYYESYSAWPVYYYLKYFNKSARLFVHYHEYSSPEWYETGMRLVKVYHQLERKYLYERAEWISQTNDYRTNFFLRDVPGLDESKVKVMGNYPPAQWYSNEKKSKAPGKPTKFVYVGSLSMGGTFLEEFCQWVISQKGEASFDIYSFNLTENTRNYLTGLDSSLINFHPTGIDYGNMPDMLKDYDIGVILYRANSDNVVYCISNKFYEYYACGLDIWFSKEMKATWGLENLNTNQRITKVDFESKENIEEAFLSRFKTKEYNERKDRFTYESEYQKLVDHF